MPPSLLFPLLPVLGRLGRRVATGCPKSLHLKKARQSIYLGGWCGPRDHPAGARADSGRAIAKRSAGDRTRLPPNAVGLQVFASQNVLAAENPGGVLWLVGTRVFRTHFSPGLESQLGNRQSGAGGLFPLPVARRSHLASQR